MLFNCVWLILHNATRRSIRSSKNELEKVKYRGYDMHIWFPVKLICMLVDLLPEWHRQPTQLCNSTLSTVHLRVLQILLILIILSIFHVGFRIIKRENCGFHHVVNSFGAPHGIYRLSRYFMPMDGGLQYIYVETLADVLYWEESPDRWFFELYCQLYNYIIKPYKTRPLTSRRPLSVFSRNGTITFFKIRFR